MHFHHPCSGWAAAPLQPISPFGPKFEVTGCPWGRGTAGRPSPSSTRHPGPQHRRGCARPGQPHRSASPSQMHLRALNLIKVSEKRCLGAPPGSAALNFIRSGLLLIMPAASLINNARAASRCQARRGKGFVCLFISSLFFGVWLVFFFGCRGRAGACFPSEK